MKRVHSIVRIVCIASALFLAACAGTQFVKPADSEIVVGQTSYDSVVAKLGKPVREATSTKNGHTLSTISYAYASFGLPTKTVGVIGAKNAMFTFEGQRLVGRLYSSNLKEDATDFDDTKVSQILKGSTTREQVLALMGKPAGESIFPVAKDAGESSYHYSYTEVRSTSNISHKHLNVTFDSSGVVSDVEYAKSGSWGK